MQTNVNGGGESSCEHGAKEKVEWWLAVGGGGGYTRKLAIPQEITRAAIEALRCASVIVLGDPDDNCLVAGPGCAPVLSEGGGAEVKLREQPGLPRNGPQLLGLCAQAI